MLFIDAIANISDVIPNIVDVLHYIFHELFTYLDAIMLAIVLTWPTEWFTIGRTFLAYIYINDLLLCTEKS